MPAAFVSDPARRVEIARMILSQLPEWFGIPAATEGYITDAAYEPCFVCEEDGAPVGFLCLKETGHSTVELAVMGVLKPCHRKGYGRALVDARRSLRPPGGVRIHAGQDRADGEVRGV